MIFQGAVSLVLSLALTALAIPILRRVGIVDIPGERSSHVAPTLRGGGIAVAIATLVALLTAPGIRGETRLAIVAVATGAALIGLADDVLGLSARLRLVLQVVGATAAVLLLRESLTGELVVPVVAGVMAGLWLVAVVNGVNFMDGINGLAATQAIIAGGTWALAGGLLELPILQHGGVALAAASTGFLPFNFPRARIFLGDVGSYFIGAFEAVMVLVGLSEGVPVEVMVAPLGLYLADTGFTLVRRVVRREAWLESHRDHVYQRLVRDGMTHEATTLMSASGILACAAISFVGISGAPVLRVVAVTGIVIVLTGYLASPKLRSSFGAGAHQFEAAS